MWLKELICSMAFYEKLTSRAMTSVEMTTIGGPDDSGQGPGTAYSSWQMVLIGLPLSFVTLVSISGNVLVCIAILTERKLRKVSNLFLMSLAIADLVVSSLVMPFALVNDIIGYWIFSHRFCNMWISLDILSATASILNLCAISLDRYIHMKRPFVYQEWMTNRKCLAFIALIWLASILISFLPINLGWHKNPYYEESSTNQTLPHYDNTSLVAPESNEFHFTCSLELNPTYAVVSSCISFYIPCIVMLAIYGKIYRLARYHARSIKKTQSFDPMTSTSNTRSRIGENKALFTLGMIMGLFLLSWIPFFIVNLVAAFCECVPPKVFVAFTWLGYCNSTMNPIIYSKFNADFREAFKKIICCHRCRDHDPYSINGNNSIGSNKRLQKAGNGHVSNGSIQRGLTNGLSNNNNTMTSFELQECTTPVECEKKLLGDPLLDERL